MDIDWNKIKEYNELIRSLCEERPEYAHFQKEIEEVLKKAGSKPSNRISALESLALAKRSELVHALEQLSKGMHELQNEYKKLIVEQEKKDGKKE